ncbi:MAG: hypothetical protein U1B78_06165 [Dehalococcoidia bacterium]|nr:hypothetical protein [Dehalococcoidia bacterium]MDZ4278708.1 hypothetical protein [Dehalococcoidia bacterium]
MREILEEAAILYRQELESLQPIAAPVAVAGPILVIIATSSLIAALATTLVLLFLYGIAYAACVRAASLMLENSSPGAGDAYLDAFRAAYTLLRNGAPAMLLIAAIAGSALVISDQGFTSVSMLIGALGAATVVVWAGRHAYETPLVLLYGMSATDAEGASARLTGGETLGASGFLAIVSLPVVIAALLGCGIGAALAPPVGAAVFLIVVALWLPFAALSVTLACGRLVESAGVAT